MPNIVHLHLLLNHWPIIGLPLTAVFLAVGIWRKNVLLRVTAHAMIIAVALLTVAAFLTGDPAADAVESLDGVEVTAIRPHDHAGLRATVVGAAAAVVALAALVQTRRGRDTKTLDAVVLACAFVAAALAFYAGWLGGKIRHPELEERPPAAEAGLFF